jgi:ribonuclease Z
MFKIVVLGSGASVPSAHRNLPAVAMVHEGGVYLFDCGEGTQRQMMRFGVSYAKVRAVFISHLHLDHVLGLYGLAETLRLSGRTDKVQVFGPAGTRRLFEGKILLDVHEIAGNGGRAFDAGAFVVDAVPNEHGMPGFAYVVKETDKVRFFEAKAKKAGLRGPMFTEIQKKGELAVGGKKVKLADVTYVQKGKKIVYSGDTIYCKAVVGASIGADLLIHDATFDEEMKEEAAEKKHATTADAARAAKEAGAKCLLLTHISARYSDTKPLLAQARKIFKKTEIAKDGLEIEV